MTSPYQINSQADVQIKRIGNEQQALLIIDNFLDSPQTAIDAAGSACDYREDASDFYPGARKLTEPEYARQVLNYLQQLTPSLQGIFNIPDSFSAKPLLSAYSMTTTLPDQLRPIQCVPHIDTHEGHHLAVVHYLCSEDFGGTAFYRHIDSGFEQINQPRLQPYFKTLKSQVKSGILGKSAYMDGDNALFTRIANVDVKFNRALIYQSNCLHSGNIRPELGLSANPKEGRLTANTFMQYCQEQ